MFVGLRNPASRQGGQNIDKTIAVDGFIIRSDRQLNQSGIGCGYDFTEGTTDKGCKNSTVNRPHDCIVKLYNTIWVIAPNDMACLPIPCRNEQSITFHITIQELMYGKHGSLVPDYYHYNHSFLRLCFSLTTMVTVTSAPVLSGVRLVLVLVSLMCSSYYENQSVSIPFGKFFSGEVCFCHQGLQLAGHHLITA